MDLAETARRLLDDYDNHHPGTVFAKDWFHVTLEQAWELQARVAALRVARGERVAGYKVGCVSESVRRQLGLSHAVFGRVFAGELHESGCELDAAGYEGLAIEGEFAVRLGAEGEVSSVFPVIELHNYIFRRANQRAEELIANNAVHAGVVMAAAGRPLREAGDEPIEVRINGERKGASDGIGLAGAIAESLRLLADGLGRMGLRVEPGQIVLTGSPLPLYRVEKGDRIEVRCPSFPVVAATVGR